MERKKDKGPLGVYVHIPFCVKKCQYCDFLSYASDAATREAYVSAVCREIRSYEEKMKAYQVQTIYFGGGTPSSLQGEEIAEILHTIYETGEISNPEDLEITLEVNPKTVHEEKWRAYKEAGINRLSIGLQSTQDEELQLLGRIHTYEEFLACYTQAREFGFANISVDVMSALPGQSLEKYEETLYRIVRLQPEHISSYSLIIEENTPFWDLYGENGEKQGELPDEELDRKMYEQTGKILRQYGYERYEISNYAKAGYESKHNSSYWIGTPYLGIGLGASSFLEGKRYANVTEMADYLQHAGEWGTCIKDISLVSEQEAMEEFMFLGLRMMRGVKKSDFLKRFGINMEQIYGSTLKKLQEQGLIQNLHDSVKLTEFGIDVSNVVFREFLLS